MQNPKTSLSFSFNIFNSEKNTSTLNLSMSMAFLSIYHLLYISFLGNITGKVIFGSSDLLVCFLFLHTSIYSDISNCHLKTSWCLFICRQFIWTCQSYCTKTRFLSYFNQHSTLIYSFNHSPEPWHYIAPCSVAYY